jgi:hypothetical protein
MRIILLVIVAILALLPAKHSQTVRQSVHQPERTPTVQPQAMHTVAPLEDGVFMDNTSPKYKMTCQDVQVTGNPDPLILNDLYLLPKGTTIRIRERSKKGDYVMIQDSEWIPLSSLCK